MAVIATIAAAVKLADVLGIDEWFGDLIGGKPGQQVASKVMDVAKAVTGTDDIEAISKELQENSELRMQIKKAILSNEHELRLAAYADKESARQMYQNTDHKLADEIAKRIMKFNPLYILALVVAYVVLFIFVEDKTLAIAGSSVISSAITYLWNERQAVVNFLFGSSLGSKQKGEELRSRSNI